MAMLKAREVRRVRREILQYMVSDRAVDDRFGKKNS